jgi:hypothetical protein
MGDTDTKDTDPKPDPDDKPVDGGDKKPSGRVTLADVRKEINEALDSALTPIKEALLGKDTDADSSDQKDVDETKGDSKRQPGFRQIERLVTKATEEAVAKITHEAEHKALKEPKKEAESTPVKKRLSTRLMGWD